MRTYNRHLYPTLAHRIFRRILWIFEWFYNFLIGLFLYGIPLISVKSFSYLKRSESLVIIANGPSIIDQMNDIEKHKECDFACMNYFPVYSKAFERLRPCYFFGVDTMLYDINHPDEEKRKDTRILREKMNNVGWNMIAFMNMDESLKLKNRKIKEIRLTGYMIDGVYSKFRGKLFDYNLALPKTNTVATLAILTGIRLGYKNIYLYGLDMSQFENIKVDKNNRTINSDPHFYEHDNKKSILKNDIVGVNMAGYYSLMSFRTLNIYAKERECKIYNCSNHSYVDAFERK